MSFELLRRKRTDTPYAWKARTRIREHTNLPHGRVSTDRKSVHQTFDFPDTPLVQEGGKILRVDDDRGRAHEYCFVDNENFPLIQNALGKAEAWVRAQQLDRQNTEAKIAAGVAPDAPLAMDRTMRQIVDLYYEDLSYVSLKLSSQLGIRKWTEDLVRWNEQHGGGRYVSQWTEDLAKKRIAYVLATRDGTGRNNQLIYDRKMFQLELLRKPSALTSNPYPLHSPKKNKRSNKKPRCFTWEEIRAILDCSPPYVRLLWIMLLYTGVRSEELLTLPIDGIEFEDGQPTLLTIEAANSKTGAAREIDLHPCAADAIVTLMGLADDSGFLVRRDFVMSKTTGSRKKTPLWEAYKLVLRDVLKKYPHLKSLAARTIVRDDTAPTQVDTGKRKRKPRFVTSPHTWRKTFATHMLLAKHDLVTVADLLGDTVETVANHYAAVIKTGRRAAVLSLANWDESPTAENSNWAPTGHRQTVARMNSSEINSNINSRSMSENT